MVIETNYYLLKPYISLGQILLYLQQNEGNNKTHCFLAIPPLPSTMPMPPPALRTASAPPSPVESAFMWLPKKVTESHKPNITAPIIFSAKFSVAFHSKSILALKPRSNTSVSYPLLINHKAPGKKLFYTKKVTLRTDLLYERRNKGKYLSWGWSKALWSVWSSSGWRCRMEI